MKLNISSIIYLKIPCTIEWHINEVEMKEHKIGSIINLSLNKTQGKNGIDYIFTIDRTLQPTLGDENR